MCRHGSFGPHRHHEVKNGGALGRMLFPRDGVFQLDDPPSEDIYIDLNIEIVGIVHR